MVSLTKSLCKGLDFVGVNCGDLGTVTADYDLFRSILSINLRYFCLNYSAEIYWPIFGLNE